MTTCEIYPFVFTSIYFLIGIWLIFDDRIRKTLFRIQQFLRSGENEPKTL